MDEIMILKKQLSENEFEIRSLENTLKENISMIKSEVSNWTKIGIITPEQEQMINGLSLENIKNGDLEQFKSLYTSLQEILNKFNTNIQDLESQLKQVENM